MSFDEILDLTAGVCFFVNTCQYLVRRTSMIPGMSQPTDLYDLLKGQADYHLAGAIC